METKLRFEAPCDAIAVPTVRVPHPRWRNRPSMEIAPSAEEEPVNGDTRGIVPHSMSAGCVGGAPR